MINRPSLASRKTALPGERLHKILVSAYHMLREGVDYKDLGPKYLDSLNHASTTRNLVRRLERLGYVVEVKQEAA